MSDDPLRALLILTLFAAVLLFALFSSRFFLRSLDADASRLQVIVTPDLLLLNTL